ncbi:hypothetical protein OE88DRAFT_1654169 [Heliocybe sulcata]|uniref:Uncharacterized protein n=1 Tax=Heliocybe sulcata TaxID=5364 RepID=A0A5C3NBZ0_9AGAM|nr:hypothetical protein OE88DRAFT_1654169 [Heliocybe sulcata]
MLLRRPLLLPQSLERAFGRSRWTSSKAAAPPYHEKVRVYPFRVSPRDATRNMSRVAAIPFIGHCIKSWFARNFPGLGIEPIKPAKFEALYLPGWLVDAEVMVDAWITVEGELKERKSMLVNLVNSYMPGHSQEPLSRISLNNPALYELSTLPWSSVPETQYGFRPRCIPFSVSPLGFPSVMRKLSSAAGYINHHMRFNPQTIRPGLLAAYPILIPIYSARYQYKIKDQLFSFVVLHEAHSRQGRIISATSMKIQGTHVDEQDVKDTSELVNPEADLDFVYYKPGPTPFAAFKHVSIAKEHDQRSHELDRWAYKMAGKHRSFEKLAQHREMQKVDMDDHRVQVFSNWQVGKNQNWLAISFLENILRCYLEVYRSFLHSVARVTKHCPGFNRYRAFARRH